MTDVDVVRRAFVAFMQNDFQGWFALAREDCRLYPRTEEPGVADCYEGWDGVLDYLVNWYGGWEEYEVEPVRFVDAGEYVLVDVREVGVASNTAIRIEDTFAHAFKVTDGKILEWRMYGPMEEAVRALGLPPGTA